MEEEVDQQLLRSLEEGEEEPLRFLVVDKRPVHPLEQHQQQRLQQHLLAISLDHRPVMHKQLVVQSLVEEEAHLEVEQQHRVKDRYLVAVHQPAVAFLLPVHPRHLPLGGTSSTTRGSDESLWRWRSSDDCLWTATVTVWRRWRCSGSSIWCGNVWKASG